MPGFGARKIAIKSLPNLAATREAFELRSVLSNQALSNGGDQAFRRASSVRPEFSLSSQIRERPSARRNGSVFDGLPIDSCSAMKCYGR
jgi:hypothetical protein